VAPLPSTAVAHENRISDTIIALTLDRSLAAAAPCEPTLVVLCVPSARVDVCLKDEAGPITLSNGPSAASSRRVLQWNVLRARIEITLFLFCQLSAFDGGVTGHALCAPRRAAENPLPLFSSTTITISHYTMQVAAAVG
jgi:hypothetical protein